jgi:hypothetical protein
MARGNTSGRRVKAADVPFIIGMIARGDRHHDIAAWFGLNQGRIAETQGMALHKLALVLSYRQRGRLV